MTPVISYNIEHLTCSASVVKVQMVQPPWNTTWFFFNFFFNFFFFWCGPFLKSLLNLLQHCFCFMLWFFGCKTCGILAPWPGIEPAPPALEGEVLTTGPPEKSLDFFKIKLNIHMFYVWFSISTSSLPKRNLQKTWGKCL